MPDARALTAAEISLLAGWESPGFAAMREVAFSAFLGGDSWLFNRLSPGQLGDINLVVRGVRGEASQAEMAKLDFGARRSL
jgi:hypothetical protein